MNNPVYINSVVFIFQINFRKKNGFSYKQNKGNNSYTARFYVIVPEMAILILKTFCPKSAPFVGFTLSSFDNSAISESIPGCFFERRFNSLVKPSVGITLIFISGQFS